MSKPLDWFKHYWILSKHHFGYKGEIKTIDSRNTAEKDIIGIITRKNALSLEQDLGNRQQRFRRIVSGNNVLKFGTENTPWKKSSQNNQS